MTRRSGAVQDRVQMLKAAGMTHDEIARDLGICTTTVSRHLTLARLPWQDGKHWCSRCKGWKPEAEFRASNNAPRRHCKRCREARQYRSDHLRNLRAVEPEQPAEKPWLDAWLALHLPMPVPA